MSKPLPSRAELSVFLAVSKSRADLDLQFLGAHLAQKNGWNLSEIEAVHYHLIRTFHWLPRDVRSMSTEDMLLACAEELKSVPASDEQNQASLLLAEVTLASQMRPSK